VSQLGTQELRARLQELRPYFYSPYDFGDGLVTRPARVHRRFRRRLELLAIPSDLSGKTVLDIGAYDGFFSFEFERRGAARVLAIDTYSWDKQRGLECFLAAREFFNSKVEHRRMDVSELCPQEVGTFDLVFCAGLLYHVQDPLLALKRIRSVTRKQLILETVCLIPAMHESLPMITLFAGDSEHVEMGTKLSHFRGGAAATQTWIANALTIAGFDRHEMVYTPSFHLLKKIGALLTTRAQSGRITAHAFVEQADG
jgi:tRNA (mo5U34)-methyltransferase